MRPELTFRPLFEADFELDEEAPGARERGEATIGDKNVRVLLRQNRIALHKGETTKCPAKTEADRSKAYYAVPLICVVHSHPACRFEWSRLTIDLSPTTGAIIRDMVPLEVRGDKPVEITTKVGIGVKFETVHKVLSAELKPEYESSRTCYYPEIVSSGIGFDVGFWDFLALTSDYLHANRELHLLIEAPTDKPPLVRFRLEAKVTVAGVVGSLPLVARKGVIDGVYALD